MNIKIFNTYFSVHDRKHDDLIDVPGCTCQNAWWSHTTPKAVSAAKKSLSPLPIINVYIYIHIYIFIY